MSKIISPKYPVRSQTQLTDRNDSGRWDHYKPRDGDVVVATYPKCGTTWMEMIVLNLIHQGDEKPLLHDVAPWVELRFPRGVSGVPERPIEEIIAIMEKQTHRRQMKTHLPLDFLLFYPETKYIVVGRDARDTCMSFYNHQLHLVSIEPIDKNVGAFWRDWILSPGEGKPHVHFRYYQRWWDYRHLENILFVHFNDLKQDLKGEIRRVGAFMEIDTSEELLEAVTHATTFSTVKANAEKLLPGMSTFRGGANTFINKGTNGRWKEELTEEDLSLYQPVAERSASPGCRAWLESGRTAVESRDRKTVKIGNV